MAKRNAKRTSPHENIANNIDMYKSQNLGSDGGDSNQQISLLKRKNANLKKENDLIRLELKTLKELQKSKAMDQSQSILNAGNDEELARLTKEVSKLRRYKQDVSQRINLFRLKSREKETTLLRSNSGTSK